MKTDYTIEILKGLDNTANVFIKFNDEDNNEFIKLVVASYCEHKNIKPIQIRTQWTNTSKISKFFKKEPSFIAYIKFIKYTDRFSLLNELLRGQIYKFENEIELKSFIEKSKFAIKDFLDENLSDLINVLESYFIWDLDGNADDWNIIIRKYKKNFPYKEEISKEKKIDYYFDVASHYLMFPAIIAGFYLFFFGLPEWSWIPANLSSWNGFIDFFSNEFRG